jgi:hypothetical protein
LQKRPGTNPGFLFKIENLVFRASTEFSGIAGEDSEMVWSNGVSESLKYQTPSTKLQTNLKFQY